MLCRGDTRNPSRHRRPPLAVVVIVVAGTWVPVRLAAQTTPVEPAVASAPLVVGGQTIRVTTRNGAVETGRAMSITDQTIRFTVADVERSVPLADVAAIDTMYRDAPWKGMLVGAAVGGGVFAIAGMLDEPDPCRPQQWFCFVLFTRTERAVMGLALGAMIGAPAGLLIDLFKLSSKTVYRAPGPTVDLSVAPLLAPDTIGGRAVIRW